MSDPLDEAIRAVAGFSDSLAETSYRVELAKILRYKGRLKEALDCVEKIPHQTEKKNALLHWIIDEIERDSLEEESLRLLHRMVREILRLDPKNTGLVGRLALSMLTHRRVHEALNLLQLTPEPFNFNQERYDFIDQALPLAGENIDDVVKLIDGFTDQDYAQWAKFSWAKSLFQLNRLTELGQMIKSFSSVTKQAWVYYTIASSAERDQAKEFLLQADQLLKEYVGPSEEIESLVIQSRILGKALYYVGLRDESEEVFERTEALISEIPLLFQRYRAQLLLAGVLKRYGMIDSVKSYLDFQSVPLGNWSAIQVSQWYQWLAEAETGNETYWMKSIQSVLNKNPSNQNRMVNDFDRADRLALLVKRYAYSSEVHEPSGQVKQDEERLSAEEFEAYYYSPFAIENCCNHVAQIVK